MDIRQLNSLQLIDFLKAKEIPEEVCDALSENCMDGSTLFDMLDDVDEFKTVLPKSGHRLKVKRAVKCKEAMNEVIQVEDITFNDLVAFTNLETNTSFDNATAFFDKPITTSTPTTHDALKESAARKCGHWVRDWESACNSLPTPETSDANVLMNSTWPPFHQTSSMNEVVCTGQAISKPVTNSNETSSMNEVVCSGQAISKPDTNSNDVENLPAGTVIKKEKLDETRSLGNRLLDLPFPERFSIRVEAAIKSGNVLPVRQQLVADVGTFLYGLSSHPQQGDYKRMSLQICKHFPELRDSNPANYWVSVQKQLSQFIRNQRRYSKTSSSTHSKPTSKVPATKRAKVEANGDNVTQKRNLDLLRDYKGSISGKTFTTLINETFDERRKFIQTSAKSSCEVLDMCPYLGKPEHVQKEMERIIDGYSIDHAVEHVCSAFKCILGTNNDELSTKDVVDAVAIIERKTSKKKAISVIKFKDPSTKPETLFKDKIVEFRLVCLGTATDVQQIFVSGEDRVFFECSNALPRALVELISAYYVFDVSYPCNMAGICFFLQDVALKQKDNKYKGTKYSSFMAELRNNLNL